MMTPEIRDKINEKIRLVGQKLKMLFANWRAESNLAAGGPQHVLTSIDVFYQSYTQTYMRKRSRLQWYIECMVLEPMKLLERNKKSHH